MNLSQIPSPCYVLEQQLFKNNREVFERIEKESGVWSLCALKGFSFYHEFETLAQSITGATASSLHEVLLAHQYFNEVHTCCPVYIDAEFAEICEKSSHVTFNTITQYHRFKDHLLEKNTALLRINPEYSEVTTDLYNPAKTNSRLGITKDELKASGGLPKEVEGLHVHALCENDSFTFERLFQKIEASFSDELHQVKYLNIGGGHLVTKKGYDLEHFITLTREIAEKYEVQIIMEPGSAFGWQTGFLRARVEDVIKKEKEYILMLDVSFSAHMPDCLEMPYQPDIRGFSTEKGQYAITLGGNTCLAGDEIGGYFVDQLPEVGDSLLFEDMIHYTMVKTTTFNGVKHPAIGRISPSGEFELLKQPGFNDYLSRL